MVVVEEECRRVEEVGEDLRAAEVGENLMEVEEVLSCWEEVVVGSCRWVVLEVPPGHLMRP